MAHCTLAYLDGIDTGLHLPSFQVERCNTVGERFLCDVYPDREHSFIYVSRLCSVAADDNKRDINNMQSLITGRVWETEVKAYLIQSGLSVTAPDFTRDDAGEPDLVVNKQHVVEVKSYDYNFTSPETYPHKWVWTNNAPQTEEKYALANELGGYLFFVIVSQKTGAMVGFRYKPEFFITNKKGKTVGKREHLLPMQQLLRYLKTKNLRHATNESQVNNNNNKNTNNTDLNKES